MLYLFNSAFRPVYQANVLNTLYLPRGWINEYRYSFNSHVQPALHAHPENIAKGERVIVIFIDRHAAGGFFFHPVRFGSFCGTDIHINQRHFQIALDEFIYPNDPQAFNAIIRRDCADFLPQRRGEDADAIASGYFAFQIDRDILSVTQPMRGEAAWLASCQAIAKCADYKAPDHRILFMRAALKSGRRQRQEIAPRLFGNGSEFPLDRGKRYTLELGYYFPLQETQHDARGTLSIQLPPTIIATGATTFDIGARSDRIVVPLQAAADMEATGGSIAAKFTTLSANGSEEGVATDKNLSVALTVSPRHWIFVFLLLLVYAVTLWALAVDLRPVLPNGVTQYPPPNTLWQRLQQHWQEVKLPFSIIQTFALFFFVKLYGGKKPL